MHSLSPITGYSGSYVLVASVTPPTRALIFVHGFGGDSVSTWNHFQQLADADAFAAVFGSTDLFFYDYQSTRHTIAHSADDLNNFITQILRDRGCPYASIHLIGHSTGAVVMRQLLVDLTRGSTQSQYASLITSSQPLLFSPAHRGFRHSLAALLFVQSIPFVGMAAAVWQLGRGKVYPDLQPDSPVLNDLKTDTVRGVQNGGPPALSAKNYWGKDENVVFVGDYPSDTRQAFEPGFDHFSICKPSNSKHLPIKWVIDAI